MTYSAKKIIHQIHLVLGLLSGIIVFIVSITGALWVFQEEITGYLTPSPQVIQENKPFISPERAKQIALEVFPNHTIHGAAYKQNGEALEVIFYEAEPEFYQSVFLHPYTGEVLSIKNHREGFFWFVLRGHLYLWLPHNIGSFITRYATMIFVLMLFSGLYLWWPKHKRAFRQRIRFLWKPTTRWRRKNYDLHNILGFYVSLVALLISFSGLIMAFDWVATLTYKTWGGTKNIAFMIPNNTSNLPNNTSSTIQLQSLIDRMIKETPNYNEIEIHYPHSDSTCIYIEVNPATSTYYKADYRFFNQYSAKEASPNSIYSTYKSASLADKVMRMNYDIHVGAIGGLLGKFLAFLASLIAASLPISGFLIWYGRRKKQ